MSTPAGWEVVIGLEVHAQLRTASKIFSRESAAFGGDPNTHVNEVCAGLPGVLPVLNAEAVEMAMKAGYALGCTVHLWSQFARKNYFYPDLPKGYQISQYKHPICEHGLLEYPFGDDLKRCGITRIHMEEDAGKSTHRSDASLVDLNRAGVPLIEIVSEPELRSAEEAVAYLKELRNILRTLDVCDGNMEEGSFRCDANVSVRRPGEPLGTRAELKNINSFRFIQRAIEFEVNRQVDLIESGGQVVQETRLYNSDTGRTFSMRSKEEAHDYRYFPDPDLPPLIIDPDHAQRVKAALPELPAERRRRYQDQLGLSPYDATNLAATPALAAFFDAALAAHPDNPKGLANWTLNDLLAIVPNAEDGIAASPISPQHLAALVRLIDSGDLTIKLAKTVFDHMRQGQGHPADIADAHGLRPLRDEARLATIATEIMDANPGQVEQYRGGKDKLFGFFMGQLMQKTKGKADPDVAKVVLERLLKG